MIEIKKADLKDFETLAKLISNDIAWSRYGIDYEIAFQLISSAEDEFYVARNDQEVVGFCTLRLNGVGNILICSTDNLGAQRFYEREGFKQVGILDGLVVPGHDEIMYWKSAGALR